MAHTGSYGDTPDNPGKKAYGEAVLTCDAHKLAYGFRVNCNLAQGHTGSHYGELVLTTYDGSVTYKEVWGNSDP